MERRFKITVEGRQYNVTVEEQTDLNNVHNLEPSVVPPSHLIMPPYTPAAPGNNSAYPAPAAPRVAAEAGDIVSPLNGVVDVVNVTEGQQVAAGDCVLVVEVMKMKTPVTAQAAGKIKAVLVKPGDGVESGQVLVKMA
jgi:glutaconyl-CoA/methylmalonyl-CoA decarboxylase subunit gamma